MEPISRESPAPALARGIALLQQLSRDGQSSLEQLARCSGWPKSSTLRYLQTLREAGVVDQDPVSRAWRAVQVLKPAVEGAAMLARARQLLPELATQSGHCAELYRVSEHEVALVDRVQPESAELGVHARIGFVRNLDELDATSSLYHAFGSNQSTNPRMWVWQHGKEHKLSASERDERVANARSNRFSMDADFNSNGVRRFSVPIFEDNRLVGLLAIAQRLTPRSDQETDQIASLIQDASAALQ